MSCKIDKYDADFAEAPFDFFTVGTVTVKK
jgi:hypothetical protein